MTLDYTTANQVKTTILDYFDKILDDFDNADPMGVGTKSSAAPDAIFKVDEDCKKT